VMGAEQQALFAAPAGSTLPAVDSAQARHGGVTVKEVRCRSLLNRSGIRSVDYAINPYIGCAHGCAYCYATFMRRFTGHREEWGSFVDVKVNASEVLARQITRVRDGRIAIGTVTDPYQPAEAERGITRRCLEVLRSCDSPISILTKSSLVLRDLDLLLRMRDVQVGFTLTTIDEATRCSFEITSSPVPARLTALRELAHAGVRTWAFCGPLLPFLSDSLEQMSRLFEAVAETGASSVVVDSMKLRGPIWPRVEAVLRRHHPELIGPYRRIARCRRVYHDTLMVQARKLATKWGLLCST
jgi:DNA repair photolyase